MGAEIIALGMALSDPLPVYDSQRHIGPTILSHFCAHVRRRAFATMAEERQGKKEGTEL